MWIDGRILNRVLLLIAVVGLGAGLTARLLELPSVAQWACGLGAIPVIASLAFSIVRDLWVGRIGVDAIAFISMTGALALGESLAGVIVAIMYAGGNLLEDFAVGRAERDLKALVDRAPRLAHRKSGEAIEDVPIDGIVVGDAILVRAGEVVPIDGLVASAAALIDEAALTGEPIPVARKAGEAVRSGTVNAGEAFEMKASATAGESTYSGIVRMVSAAQAAKAPFMRMADRYALLLLPVTLIVAGGAWWFSGDPIRALAVVVAATPCPLILAAPAAFIGGTSLAARRGILIKGGGPLEILARTRTVLFDKTGTLTVGGARLVSIETARGTSPDEALRLAASLEQASHHVLAATIVSTARSKGLVLAAPQDLREILGAGLEGMVEGKQISVGSLRFVRPNGQLEDWARRAARRASWRSALTVFVAVEGIVVAVLLFADELRREAPRAINALRRAGVQKIVMVTGDRVEPAEAIGAALDLDAVLAERAPSDKVEAVVAECRMAPTLMVGDGINDAPALAAANVGMAMGARGASASSEAADAVLLVDRLDRVAEAVAIGKRTRVIALQSVVAGMAMSGVTMIAAAFGHVTPVAGALIQEAIDVAVILNALRALSPGSAFEALPMPEAAAGVLREDHERVETSLERLRQIADSLDGCESEEAAKLIVEANAIVGQGVVKHEREDEETIYPRVSKFLADEHGLSAMSRAHREILHQARLLARLVDGLDPQDVEPYIVRDAQRIVESIVSLVHIHNAQEEDIYEYAAARIGRSTHTPRSGPSKSDGAQKPTAFDRALGGGLGDQRGWTILVSVLITSAIASAALWGGWRYWRIDHAEQSPHEVAVAAAATISALDATPIKAEISGVVDAVYCDVGAVVQAGQLCATIAARALREELARDAAVLRQVAAEAEKVRADAAKSKAAVERMEAGGAHGRQLLSAARKANDRARARILREDTKVAMAEAAMKAARTAFERTKLKSPIAGTIIARAAEVGMEVSAGSEPPFLVTPDLSIVKVEVRVDAAIARRWKVGDEISFGVERVPGRLFQGKVTAMSQAPNLEGKERIELIIAAENNSGLLQPETSAKINLESSIAPP